MLGEDFSRLVVQDVVAGGRHTLVLAGEIDVETAPKLEEAARGIFGGTLQRFVIDLRKVTFLDSSGLAVILKIYNHCREQGAELGLIPGKGQVQRLLELTGVADLLPFLPQSESTTTDL